MRDGKPFRMNVQHAEKVYQTYMLEVTDPGGHSASGRRDNAIYRLAEALRRLGQFDFPVGLNPVTRAFFERMATVEAAVDGRCDRALLAGRTDDEALKPLTLRPDYNAVMRTTCVATLLEAGHAENALPQTARATVNCRILPDQSVEEVERTLDRVICGRESQDHPQRPSGPKPAVANQPRSHARGRSARGRDVAGRPGHSDHVRRLYRQPLAAQRRDTILRRLGAVHRSRQQWQSHGLNEQVGVKELYDSKEFLYRLVKQLAGPNRATAQ